MHEYISTKEASEKWNLSIRRIQILCTKGRVSGAEKHGKVWMIPSSFPVAAAWISVLREILQSEKNQ